MWFLWSHRKAHTSWGKTSHTNSKGNEHNQQVLAKVTHARSHNAIASAARRTPSRRVPPGSAWKQVPLLADRAGSLPQHYRHCKTAMNWSGLDFPLSCSACRLCTNLYLSSHHTSAWEWLAFPQGHSIWSPCFTHTDTHAFIILLLYFPPRLAVHPVPAIRRGRRCFSLSVQFRLGAMQNLVISRGDGQQTHPAPWQHTPPYHSSTSLEPYAPC